MNKSKLQFIREIVLLAILLPFLCLNFFYKYLIYLKSKGYDSVLLKMIDNINMNTMSIGLGILIFTILIFGLPTLAFFLGYKRKIISYETFDKINLIMLKLGILTFILVFFSIALNESQFSFFTTFIAFLLLFDRLSLKLSKVLIISERIVVINVCNIKIYPTIVIAFINSLLISSKYSDNTSTPPFTSLKIREVFV